MKVKGPLFVKKDGEFELAECCKECAFGDEAGCLLNPCIYFDFPREEEDESQNLPRS